MCCSKERDKRNFVNEYVRALNNGRGAIFAGAGLSIPSKGVNWKELLRDEAKAIDLDVDKETDLISVAQYIFNESRTRQTITRLLKNEINKKGNININHEIISSLPIKKVWTTNYDDFLEKSFDSVGKIADIKRTVYDMATEIDDADLTIYKMHNEDSYISLVHFDDFKKQYNHYIDIAKSKRDRMDQFELVKKMK